MLNYESVQGPDLSSRLISKMAFSPSLNTISAFRSLPNLRLEEIESGLIVLCLGCVSLLLAGFCQLLDLQTVILHRCEFDQRQLTSSFAMASSISSLRMDDALIWYLPSAS